MRPGAVYSFEQTGGNNNAGEEVAVAEMVFGMHSGVRYAVLLLGLVALIVTLLGWRRGGAEAGSERGAMAAFVGVLDLQVLLGIVLLMQRPFYAQLIGHIVMMVLAAAAAHIGAVRAKRQVAEGRNAARIRFITVVVALVLIVGGILAIQRPVI